MKKVKEVLKNVFSKTKDFVKKYQNIIIICLVVLVIVGTFLISMYGMPKAFKEISYEEYVEMVEDGKEVYVYVGNGEDEINTLSTFAEENEFNINYLDSSKLTDDQLKEIYGEEEAKSVFMGWKDKEESYYYDGEFKSYKLQKDMMANDVIDSKVITVTIPEYLEIIKEKEFNLMFIGSATCGYCTMFHPELEKVLESYDVNIYYVDLSTASSEDLNSLYSSDKYFVEEQWGTPLTFLYKNGKRVDVISGYVEAATVVETLKSNKVI